jgi:hypothetical protein
VENVVMPRDNGAARLPPASPQPDGDPRSGPPPA